jgi:hypothetical protein
MTDWMRRLNELILEKDPDEDSDNSANSSPIVTNVTIVTGTSSPNRPSTDADGVPCGGCPGCGQGECGAGPSSIPSMTPPIGDVASATRSSTAAAHVTSAGCRIRC